jgi:hypothetical protein
VENPRRHGWGAAHGDAAAVRLRYVCALVNEARDVQSFAITRSMLSVALLSRPGMLS